MTGFSFGHAAGADWREAADQCLATLGPVPEAGNLGILYVTDALAGHMGEVLDRFRASTGVTHWVGTVGIGICATGVEYYEQSAVAAMIGEFPDDSFRVFSPILKDLDDFTRRNNDWIKTHQPFLGLVHADPSNPLTEALVKQLAERTVSGFLVGGLASSQESTYLYADGLTQGGVAGVFFSQEVGVVTRLSQGCVPIGPHRVVTEAQRNIMIQLDGRPALDVLKEDIGKILSRDLARIGGYIFVGLPIAGSDTGDYLVRSLVGIDPQNGLVAIGDLVEQGGRVMFCRRDANTAREDLLRMLTAIKKTLDGSPRGGIYISCLGRGRNLFGEDSDELKLIASELGDFPLVGFYANGEIFQDRLYGYTGVLTLFT
ncbi:FIST signal transduction protein [Candidatus Thiosymbion oneisti]|uniref:FIST signal transduction protein n=1 Tax=Candidatus Thiosymbion oneisti TaxID=589554 RepID=UPI000A88CE51|nr:FIST N-terminal domain-containing protein [Candidatus Thiosymbion oneisti]